MEAQRITETINTNELLALVELTRGTRPETKRREPSALRGLAQMVLLAIVIRELLRWLL